MKRFCLSALLPLALSVSLFADPNVTNFIDFTLVPGWDVADGVEVDASDESLDANTQSLDGFTPFDPPGSPGLLEHIFGDITGNTISRADFKAAVAAAHAEGLGGVMDFEDANTSFSGGDYVHPTEGVIAKADNGANIAAGNIFIARGTNWYYEGSAITPYRGRQEAAFDGTGPSGPDRASYDDVFFFRTETSSSKVELGAKLLGQTTSYDFDFDPADRVGIVGFAVLNYDNFQSYQPSGSYVGYPNMHAIADFTDGVTTVTQMAVGLSEQTPDGNDHYFGFRAPPGFYLDRLQVYQIGNNGRAFIGIDDLGFVQVLPDPGLAIDLVDGGGGDEVELSFTAETDVQYQIKSTGDITTPVGSWTNEGAPISGVSGAQSENLGSVAPDQEFFLIDKTLAP